MLKISKIKEYKYLNRKIKRLKLHPQEPIFIDISRKIKNFQNLQFLEICAIMLTERGKSVTISLQKY